jgi:hypothetical protein
MEQPRPDETLRDFVERRERELTHQISTLKSQIAPKETELAEIRRTKAALGMLDPGIAAELSKPNEQDVLARTYRSLGIAIREVAPANMKIKELLVRAFIDGFPQGATPGELVDYIPRAYGRVVESPSVRPNLMRLREDGVVMRSVAGRWMLDPEAKNAIGFYSADDNERARRLTWSPEDDAACKEYDANERAGVPQEDRKTWAQRRNDAKIARG